MEGAWRAEWYRNSGRLRLAAFGVQCAPGGIRAAPYGIRVEPVWNSDIGVLDEEQSVRADPETDMESKV
ncbi:hypothetical protein HOK021_01920 [Streptomyces hygroscopicus]|nr:hypothetical protein HOK021_01920 [Streptomyces hygroscopicus]